MDYDKLVEEIVNNARRDRKTLQEVQESLTKVNSDVDLGGGDLKVLMAEKITAVSDSLSRIQQTLVEVIKIQSKEKLLSKKSKQDEESERSELYDEIVEGSPEVDDLPEG